MNNVTIKSVKDIEVKLLATDDGVIKVCFPDMWYTLADHDIQYIADTAFLMLFACGDKGTKFMMPLSLSEELVVRDFLSYWDENRLQGLKQSNINCFEPVEVDKMRKVKCKECSWRGLVLDLHHSKCSGVCPVCRSWVGLKLYD